MKEVECEMSSDLIQFHTAQTTMHINPQNMRKAFAKQVPPIKAATKR